MIRRLLLGRESVICWATNNATFFAAQEARRRRRLVVVLGAQTAEYLFVCPDRPEANKWPIGYKRRHTRAHTNTIARRFALLAVRGATRTRFIL